VVDHGAGARTYCREGDRPPPPTARHALIARIASVPTETISYAAHTRPPDPHLVSPRVGASWSRRDRQRMYILYVSVSLCASAREQSECHGPRTRRSASAPGGRQGLERTTRNLPGGWAVPRALMARGGGEEDR
jgi:hypothetical protein